MDLLAALDDLLGPANVLRGEAAREKVHTLYYPVGAPLAVLRPGSTEDLSGALKLCHAAGQAVVPYGGLTNLVESAHAEAMVAITLERMGAVEEVDVVNSTLTVQAGCRLQAVQEAAEAADLFFPVDIGARGSATIGGVVSTNAGGNRVLRWGMMRDNILGLEVVLADGTIVSSLNTLIKNNAGYDLKQLFIGSEGTLGIVTRAVLRLRTRPTSQCTAFVAVDAFDDLPRLLASAHRELGGTLCAFEVMWGDVYQLVTSAPGVVPPVAQGHRYYALIEAMGSDYETDVVRFETLLVGALEGGYIADAVLSKSSAETAAMWTLREEGVGATARNGTVVIFDVSLRIGEMEAYAEEVRTALLARFGDRVAIWVFGHLGDGNVHINVNVVDDDHPAGTRHEIEDIVYRLLAPRGGSISAEHGIGLHKRDYLHLCRSSAELELMARLKTAVDPRGVLNPGKVFIV